MADVFVVEDAPLQQTIIERFLAPEHTIVGIATDGTEAVEHVNRQEPDVVIMDIDLSGIDGIAASEAIKSHRPETKIIVSTAVVNEDVKRMAADVPIEEYLIKPYSGPELLEAIEDAID